MAAYVYLKINATNMSAADAKTIVGNITQKTITSTSGASTTLTVNSTAHGFVAGDSVVLNGLQTSAGVPLANTQGPVEGVYTVATAATNSFTVTISSALTTGQAASGQVNKLQSLSSQVLNPVINLLNGLQAGSIDGVVTMAATATNHAASPAASGAFAYVNLK
jgi:hypothetical protein